MTGTILRLAGRVVRLVAAAGVLLLGWAILDPHLLVGTSAGSSLQNMLSGVVYGPVDRPAWGVVAVAFGAALVLAALPKNVADRSRRALAPHPFEIAPDENPFETVEVTRATHDSEVTAARARLETTAAPADRSHLADLLKKSGDLDETEGRLGEAIGAYEESAALRQNLVSADPANAREQRWLWLTLEVLADCREAMGQRSRAAALYREALGAAERSVALAPEDAELPVRLAHTRQEIGRLDALLAV